MFNFILATEETTEDSLKIIGYAWLPMVVWPLWETVKPGIRNNGIIHS